MAEFTYEVAKISNKNKFSEVITEIARADEEIVVLCADIMQSVGPGFIKEFPDRYISTGIAEQDMIGIAAGLATCRKKPFAITMAGFASMRACEQVRTDVAYPRLNVKIVGTHSGISAGAMGTTHHAIEDIAIMRSIPNMTVIVPADYTETEKATRALVDYDGPAFMRLARNPDPVIYREDYEFTIGKAVTLREGDDVALIAAGRMVIEAMGAAQYLAEKGISARVLNMHTIKPLDCEAVRKAAWETRLIATVEEHTIIGGLGGAVAEVAAEEGKAPVKRFGLKDAFSTIGDEKDLRRKYGLTAQDIARNVERMLN